MKKKGLFIVMTIALLVVCILPVYAGNDLDADEKIVFQTHEITDLEQLTRIAEAGVDTDSISVTDCQAELIFDGGCVRTVEAKKVTQLLETQMTRSGDTSSQYVSTVVADVVEPEMQTRGAHTHEEVKAIAHDKVKAYAKNYFTSGTIADGGVSNVPWVQLTNVSCRFTNSDGAATISDRKVSLIYGGKKLMQNGGKYVRHTKTWSASKNTETKFAPPIKEKYEELYHTFNNTVSCKVVRAGTTMTLSVSCIDANGP